MAKGKKNLGDVTLKEGVKTVCVYATFAATLLLTAAAVIIIYDRGYGDGFGDGFEEGMGEW